MMGGISESQIEWAVIDRLRRLLKEPPPTKYNVTQAFAVFIAIVAWAKSRAWVGQNDDDYQPATPADAAAHAARVRWRQQRIVEPPWSLSQVVPQKVRHDESFDPEGNDWAVNQGFSGCDAEQFLVDLRNALGHGDGRTIKPLHRLSHDDHRTLLAGFRLTIGQNELALFHEDLVRIGGVLADDFCTALSSDEVWFEQNANCGLTEEVA